MLQVIFLLSLFAVLLSATFFPFGLGFLSFVALVPLFKAILSDMPPGVSSSLREAKVGFWRGWLGGVLFFGITFYWIPFLPAENVTVPLIMFPAYMLMVAYLALYLGLFGALLRLSYANLTRRVVLLAPFMWVVMELLRARGALGFPWASLGYSLYQYPSLIQVASLGSVYLVSFLLVVVNALLYDGLIGRVRFAVAIPSAAALLVVASLGGKTAIGTSAGAERLTVGLVQPNIGSSVKWDPRFRRHNFEVLLELTETLAHAKPDLIVWPETAAPCHLRQEQAYLGLLIRKVDELKVPLLVGFPDAVPEEDGSITYFNSAALVLPERGLGTKYDKMHLVPFGERIPYDDVFPVLKRVNFGEADFERGTAWTVFELDGKKFGVLICFESIFPELVRSFKVKGAEFMLNITNDEWFGRSAAPYQHAYMAVFRAVENRMSVARCANTGISMLIDPWGRVALESGVFTREALAGTIEIVGGETFFSRHGFLLLWPLVGVALLESIVAFARGFRASSKSRSLR
ncbi:MAG: apolipoprotein N-acyltransferase [Candidatus Eiseniibacteriota bacterium]|nr:MAG: apolipoprotein N-acyltransferase [Candidatus Eisenbacteria bacterium]